MLADLVVQCDSYFDNIEKRSHRLNRPNMSFGSVAPISICDTAMGSMYLPPRKTTKLNGPRVSSFWFGGCANV